MTRVRCLVVDQEISARDCVDQQVTARCWCAKATLAVLEVSEIAVAGSRLAEQISTCKNTAQAMLRMPAAFRYAGPALRKVSGLPEPVEIPLPASPQKSLADVYREANSRTRQKATTYMVAGAMDAPARRAVPAKSERQKCHEDAIIEQENGGGGRTGTPGSGDPITKAEPGTAPTRPSRSQDEASRRVHPPNLGETTAPAPSTIEVPVIKKARVCNTPGCGKELGFLNQSGICDRCNHGVRPGGGYVECATPRCSRRVQKHLKQDRCSLCRSGVTYHLKEKPMPKCACGKGIRTGRDGELHEKCRRCREGVGEVSKKRKRVVREKAIPLPPSVPIDRRSVAGRFDPSKFSVEDLISCAHELRKRMTQLDEQVRAAEFALAGEPLMKKKAG